MSTDPKTNPPPAGGPKETLEDLVYRPSLSAGNAGVHRASPWVTIPMTILTYGCFGALAFVMAQQTEAGKELIKTVGLDLAEEAEKLDEPPPPPPPPPAAAPARLVAPKMDVKEAPPPPPINPDQETVPEVAPKELPKLNQQFAFAAPAGTVTGTGGLGVSGATPVGGLAGAGSGTGKVVDFDFSQITIKFQPPSPPYPPLARLAKIQGTVVVQIIVGTDGVPTSAKALEGPPQLRVPAENYAMQWRFAPAMQNGVPMIARFTLTMPFKLK